MAEVFELRPHFEWRGLGFISQSALKLSDAYADFDAELRYEVPGVRVADPKACQCGEVLKGVIKPWECKVFGTACTPEHAIGTCMVSPEGACAAYYNYGRFARERGPRGGGRVSAPPRRTAQPEPRAADPRDHRDRPREAPAVQGRAGDDGPRRRRQGDPDPDRGPARARLRLRGARRARRRRHRRRRRAAAWRSRPTPSSSSRSASRAARSASSPSTGPSTTSPWPAPSRWRSASRWCSRRASTPDVLRAEVEAIAAAAARRRGRGGHRRHQGRRARPRRLDVHLTPAGSGAVDARASALARARSSPATGCSSRARSASTAPRSCWPAASSASTPRSSPTRARCGRPPTR